MYEARQAVCTVLTPDRSGEAMRHGKNGKKAFGEAGKVRKGEDVNISEELQRMMTNWAMWHHGGRGGDFSPYPIYNLAAPGPRAEASMPVLNGEAVDMDAIIRALPERSNRVITIYWLWNDHPETKAKRCACSVATFYRRLETAHGEIIAAWKVKRERGSCKSDKWADLCAQSPYLLRPVASNVSEVVRGIVSAPADNPVGMNDSLRIYAVMVGEDIWYTDYDEVGRQCGSACNVRISTV